MREGVPQGAFRLSHSVPHDEETRRIISRLVLDVLGQTDEIVFLAGEFRPDGRSEALGRLASDELRGRRRAADVDPLDVGRREVRG